ncbi:MAG TPA: FAD-dependent oxidoreductase, partial [Planctomycetota bacterium]|nr:FAD-dependent oxidoreductase [Planctomycetota bacterium]
MKRLVVIGAGIAGLGAARAAWDARERVPGGLEVLVLEREAQVGGKARTRRQGEWLFETGPGAIQGSEPELEHLVRAAGLESARLRAAPEAARRFVWRGGRLREVHTRPLAFARSGLLSPLGLLRLACEPLVPARRSGPE